MNAFRTLLPLLTLFAVACQTTGPGSAHQSSCCPTEVPNPTPTHQSFTDRSLYQLDSNWTNDLGRSFKLGALRGRPQIVALFFASCTYACPIIVHDMDRIASALPDPQRTNVGLTLVTIDVERDTREALHAFRTARHLPASWTLLRGSPDDTLELAALLGVKFKREATGQFAHSNLITILNSEGEVIHQIAGLNQDIESAVKQISRDLSR